MDFDSKFGTFTLLAILKKFKFFFWKKPSIFLKENPNFEHFEKFYYFCRILKQIF